MKNTTILLTVGAAILGLPTPLPAQTATRPAERETRVYVPYKDIAAAVDPAGKAVLMDREEFEKLLAAARQGRPVGPDGRPIEGKDIGQVMLGEYTSAVRGQTATLRGELTVESLSDGVVAVPMGFAQLGLTKVTLDGKPAPLGYDARGQLVLIVTGKGTHKVSVEGSTVLTDLAGGGMQMGVVLPAAVAGTLKLSAPGDLAVHATAPLGATAYDKQADRTSVELTVGGVSALTVVLLGNGRQEDERPILLGESAISVELSRASQTMNCLYTVQVLRRGTADLTFRLPEGWTISDVACPNLTRWDVAAVKDPNGAPGQELRIRLRNPSRGTEAVHIQASAPMAKEMLVDPQSAQDDPLLRALRAEAVNAALAVEQAKTKLDSQKAIADLNVRIAALQKQIAAREEELRKSTPQKPWTSPYVNLVGAAFQRGFLTVDTGDQIRVRGQTVSGARREDRAAASAVASRIALLGAGQYLYYHWGEKWSVQLELTTIALRRASEERQEVGVFAKQVVLNSQFRVTAVGREMFDMSFELPAPDARWELASVTVNGQSGGFEYRVTEGPAGATGRPASQVLTVELSSPVPPEGAAAVNILLRHVPADWDWSAQAGGTSRTLSVPLIRATADTTTGLVFVTPWEDLSAAAEGVPAGLKEVTVGKMASLGLTGQVALAYTYESALPGAAAARGTMKLRISRGLPRIAAESVGLVTATPKTLTGLWNITYRITRAGTTRLELLADKSLGQTLKIEASNVRIASRKLLPGAAEGRYDRWELTLDGEATGDVVIHAQYERPLPEGAFAIPLVRPALRAPEEQTSELLAVQASEELAVTIESKGAGEIDAVELPALPARRILAAFRLESPSTPKGAETAVTLKTRVYENYAVPPALAGSATLVTYLAADGGQQTRAEFALTNAGLQFLKVRLPKGAQLWSMSVAAVQAKPKRDADGDYLLAVPRSSAPTAIAVVYAWKPADSSACRAALGAVELVGVNVNRTEWTVVPPPGYRVVSQETAMQAVNLTQPTLGTPSILADSEECQKAFHEIDILARPRLSAGKNEAIQAIQKQREAFEAGERTRTEDARPAPPKDLPDQGVRFSVYAIDRSGSMAGRYTLPVDLVAPPGAGPAVTFTSLGRAELVVNLAEESSLAGWWLLGWTVVFAAGCTALRARAARKALFLFVVLVAVGLAVAWWPRAARPANGAFWAALCLVPLYLVAGCVRLIVRGRSKKAIAATVLGIVLLAMPLASARAEEPAKAAAPPSASAAPLIVVPYEGDPTKAEESNKVLVPYAHFVKLWNQAHPDQPMAAPEPETGVSIADVKYAVLVAPAKDADRADRTVLSMVLTATVRTRGKGPILLPLPFAGLAVTEATLDGKAAQLQSGPKGMVLMLEGGAGGTLSVSALATPAQQGRRGGVDLVLPPLPGAVMTVQLPQEDLELEAPGVEGAVARDKGATWTVPLGMTRKVSLRWSPRAGGGAADRTLSAVAAHDVTFFHWALVGASRFTFSFSAGEHDRFALLLPEGLTLTDVSGANLRDWRAAGRSTVAGQAMRVIEVRLYKAAGSGSTTQPAEKTYELTARWVSDLPALDRPVALPLPQAGDVARESGAVVLRAAGGMGVKVADVAGGRRDPRPAGLSAAHAGAAALVGQYDWPYRPFALTVRLARQTPKVTAALDQLVRLSDHRVQLLVRANLSATDGQLFGADFALPEGYELLSAVGAAVADHYVQSHKDGQRLHVSFRGGVTGTGLSLVLVKSDANVETFAVPTASAIDADGRAIPEQSGRLAVQIAPAMEAQTLTSANLTTADPKTLTGWLEAEQINMVRFAYRYEHPDIRLALAVRRLPAKVRVEIVAAVSVQPTAALYTYRLRYTIEGSPIDRVHFTLPRKYAPLVAVVSPAMRSVTQDEPQGDRAGWTVFLVNEVTGVLDVTANFALPLPRGEEGSKFGIEVPRIGTDAPAGYHAVAVVQNFSGQELAVRDSAGLRDLPPTEQRKLLPEQALPSLQYVGQAFKDGWSLGLELTAAKAPQRIQAVADLVAITTAIDRSGQCRYEVVVSLQNRSEQFLRVKVPAGLALWSARVDEEPVRPVIPSSLA